MISDNDILNRARNWLNTSKRSDLSITHDTNGILINTNNLFEESSLEIDKSAGLRQDIVQLFKYSGIPEDQRGDYQVIEPAAFLLKGNGIESEIPFIKTIGSSGLKLSDNSSEDSIKNYENDQIILNKLYPGDNGKLKSNNKFNDIPLREIMNSEDTITFTSNENDTKNNRRKRLYVTGGSSETSQVGKNFITYLNGILNFNSVIPGVVYHGECEDFDHDILPLNTPPLSINKFCNGNFKASSDISVLVAQQSPDTEYRDINIYFERVKTGWNLKVYVDNSLAEGFPILYSSITERQSNYPTNSFPLPVYNRDNMQGDLSTKIKWTAFYKPANFDKSLIIKISLILKCDTETSDKILFIDTWDAELSKSVNGIDVIFTSNLIDSNNEKLDITKNYYISEIKFFCWNDGDIQADSLIPENNVPIDRDPFKGKISLTQLFGQHLQSS